MNHEPMAEQVKGPVTLEQILTAKEERQKRQRSLREQYGMPIASITVNIPGSSKDSPVIRRLCDHAMASIQSRFDVLAVERINAPTGPLGLLAVCTTAEHLKQVAVELEEEHDFGRLLDIDVFSADGNQLSRQMSGACRPCLLCMQPAVVCMREQRHSLAEIQEAVRTLLTRFAAYETRQISTTAETIGSLAVEAMLYEIACTPSPGLVDRINSGAHHDMDFYTFMSSSAALSLTMARCCEAGLRHDGNLVALLPVLRFIGLDGEAAMLAATNGVNTQKGLLFSLGITAAAVGWLFAVNRQVTAVSITSAIKEMTEGIVERELLALSGKTNCELTAGERLFRAYGTRGIRGEMEDGLPAVKYMALPALQAALGRGLSINQALLQTLFVLMAVVEDTTVINRHSPDKLVNWVRPLVESFLKDGGVYSDEGYGRAAELDQWFIEHNVSPGGAADLLAITWFLHALESRLNSEEAGRNKTSF